MFWTEQQPKAVLVSPDRRTMLKHFRDHLVSGKSSMWAVTKPGELKNQAYHLPSLINHRFSR